MGVASREHSTVAVKLPPKGKGAPLTAMRQLELNDAVWSCLAAVGVGRA